MGVGVGGGLGAGTGRVGGQGLPWGEFEGSSEDAVVDVGWDGGADLARGEAGNNECAVFVWSSFCASCAGLYRWYEAGRSGGRARRGTDHELD